MTDYGPTHLHAYLAAELTMCGRKRVYPVLWLYWLPAHRLGYDIELCPECERELS